MFKLILAVALIGSVAAAGDEYTAETKLYKNEVEGDGTFNYAYETSNGISAQAAGDLNGMHGGYQYVSQDGVPVQITYTADENGYHPQGDLLPTPPPIPEAILRAIAYIAAHPSKESAYNDQPRPVNTLLKSG